MATYKIPRPEDYPDTEGYAYKVIKAYGDTAHLLAMALYHLDCIVTEHERGDMLSVEIHARLSRKFLDEIPKLEQVKSIPENEITLKKGG